MFGRVGSSTAAVPACPAPQISHRTLERLRASVESNPVTIVVGPTGSGKSTRIPGLVLDIAKCPVLCTQPRRLAVVAVASRVASERQVRLGGDQVGYHVGQSRHCTPRTQLLFVTAGILLEQLCRCSGGGIQVWLKYRVIILDECHERSPESDLVLGLLRWLLQRYAATKPIRLILMSATFDHERYQSFFSRVPGCERGRIDTIQLETAASFEAFHTQVRVHHLDDIFQRIPGLARKHVEFKAAMTVHPEEDLNHDRGKSLSQHLIKFVLDLVLYLHNEDEDQNEDCSGVFVIFAPTYRHLEQLFVELNQQRPNPEAHASTWKISVLHSSVDMEHCLRIMKQDSCTAAANNKPARRIFLASAIADSSITIPNVRVVIDLCRSLQTRWNAKERSWVPQTTWASQSICDQRKGRTGRTCSGQVYRLLPQSFFLRNLPQHEIPQLTLASCRDETLKLMTAPNMDPIALMCHECLDPPPESVVQDALDYLVKIGAATVSIKKNKKKYQTTQAGKLMAALAFPVEEALLILTGARLALLHEVLVLRTILTHKPTPIVQYFGQNVRNRQLLARFHYPEQTSDSSNTNASVALAHLSAYFYWDCHWNQGRTQAMLQQFGIGTQSNTNNIRPGNNNNSNDWKSILSPESLPFSNDLVNAQSHCCGVSKWTPELEERHAEWCALHEINPTAVRSIAALVTNACRVFYYFDFEPAWLRCSNPTFTWRLGVQYNNNSYNDSYSSDYRMLQTAYGPVKGKALINVLTQLCDNPSWALDQARLYISPSASSAQPKTPTNSPPPRYACIHFLRGRCAFGENCRFEHDTLLPAPPCKFKRSCSNPQCLFSHETQDSNNNNGDDERDRLLDPLHWMDPIAPVLPQYQLHCLEWFKELNSNHIMLLGERNLEFIRALASLGLPPRAASVIWDDDDGDYPVAGVDGLEMGSTTLLNVKPTRLHLNRRVLQLMSQVDRFVWMFPGSTEDDEGGEEEDSSQESLILGTFLSLTHLLLTSNELNAFCWKEQIDWGIALHSDQFSRWNVLESAMKCGWHLTAWGTLSHMDFPNYSPRRGASRECFEPKEARLYHFTYTAELPDLDGPYEDELF